MTDGWDADQYARFAAERRQPFDDLKALCLPVDGGRIVDLGCGTGELTAELHRDLRAGETIGIDRSPGMLADASRIAEGVAGLHFEEADIEVWEDRGMGLVFANASLHWVPDHRRLLARLVSALGPGGQLAFQVPAAFTHPSHRLAAEVASAPPFAPAHHGLLSPDAVLTPAGYAELLFELGALRQHVRLQVYGHLLPSVDAVVEWVRGSALTPIKASLGEERFGDFLAAYRERLVAELGERSPYFYAFSRILCWARFP